MEQDHPCAGPEVDCQEHISLWQAVPRFFYLFFSLWWTGHLSIVFPCLRPEIWDRLQQHASLRAVWRMNQFFKILSLIYTVINKKTYTYMLNYMCSQYLYIYKYIIPYCIWKYIKINIYLELCSYIANIYSHINVTIWAPYMLTYISQYMESGNSWCIIQYIVIYYHNVLF